MRCVLLGLAAALAATGAGRASAQSWAHAGLTAGPAFTAGAGEVTVHHGGPGFSDGQFVGGHRDRDRHDRSHRRRVHDGILGGPWYYDGDYDSNRSFDPDRWNDWWHERPWRAYPRWVQHNQNCEPDRMWQGGGVWRCGW